METFGVRNLLIIQKLVSYKVAQIWNTYFKFTLAVLDKLFGTENLKKVFKEDIFPGFIFTNLTQNLKIKSRKSWQIWTNCKNNLCKFFSHGSIANINTTRKPFSGFLRKKFFITSFLFLLLLTSKKFFYLKERSKLI